MADPPCETSPIVAPATSISSNGASGLRAPEQESISAAGLTTNWLTSTRSRNGRLEQSRFCIVDSPSVKNTDSAELKCYDSGKKVVWNQALHIAVDTQGLLHAILVTTANVTDLALGALAMFDPRQCRP